MYLQEPSTPMLCKKRRRVKKRVEMDDAKVAEFLSFGSRLDASNDCQNMSTDCKKEEDMIEDRVESWLTMRDVNRSSPDEVKYSFYEKRRVEISSDFEESPKSEQTQSSNFSEKIMSFSLQKSSISSRRGINPILVLEDSDMKQKSFTSYRCCKKDYHSEYFNKIETIRKLPFTQESDEKYESIPF